MVSTELERERDYVDMLYRRLDELPNEAKDQLASIRLPNVGDHDQSRPERDSATKTESCSCAKWGSASHSDDSNSTPTTTAP